MNTTLGPSFRELCSVKPPFVALALVLGASCGTSGGTPASRASTGGAGGAAASAGSSSAGTAGSGGALSGGSAGVGGNAGAPAEGGVAGEDPSEGGNGQGGSDDGTRVFGHVVELDTRRPLPGRLVMVRDPLDVTRSAETTTDERGMFSLERTSEVYEAVVLEPDRSSLTIFQNLRRSQAVLVHRSPVAPTADTKLATVSGSVSGVATFPLSGDRQVLSLYLFTEESADRYFMGAGGPPYGPEYLTTARFDARSVSSTLFALGTFGSEDAASTPAYVAATAVHTLTLSDGDAAVLDIELEPAPLGLIAGSVVVPAGRTLTSTRQHYRLPYPEAIVPFPAADYVRKNPLTSNGEFEFELPNLGDGGASLCLAAASEREGDGDAELRTERCGVVLDGASVSIELQAAPSLSSPTAGGMLDAATRFAWSPFAGGVTELRVWPDAPSPERPGISLFTEESSAGLPDLGAWNVTLPADIDYHVTVTGFSPYTSLDAAVAPEALGASIPTELRVSSSAAVIVTTAP